MKDNRNRIIETTLPDHPSREPPSLSRGPRFGVRHTRPGIQGSGFQDSSEVRCLRFMVRVSKSEIRVLGFGFRVSRLGFRSLEFAFWVSGFEILVPRFGF